MKKLKYIKSVANNEAVELGILNTYEIEKSSQEVSFSDIDCDFTEFTAEDLPEKYQEVQIIDDETNEIKYFGYVDQYSFKEMRETDKFTEISFTLLSPMKLATLRTFIAIGSYNLEDLIRNIILKPLINDGFTIEKLSVPNKTISANYLSKTIEYGLNTLSNQYNLWWFIDENKKIYIQTIDQLLSKDADYIYDDSHKINGLQYLRPTVASDNYANVINFSNVRVYEYSVLDFNEQDEMYYQVVPLISEQIAGLTKGQQLLFRHPVDLNKQNILKAGRSYEPRPEYIGLQVEGKYSDNTTFEFYINYYIVETNTWLTSSNVGFVGDENTDKEFLLIRDNFFSNLITGFEYNGSKTISKITTIETHSALAWEVFKFYNDKAINEKKGIINNTGIVEMTVDMNEQWKTVQELQDIGVTFMNNNSLKLDGEIELKLDKDVFKVGDILGINKMLFNGKYIVTSVHESFFNNVIEYIVTCKNANIINNYIDLFRNNLTEEDETKTYEINVSHYSGEGIKETFEVIQ